MKRLLMMCNVHTHSPTCYKYEAVNSDGDPSCRFHFPKELVAKSHLDETGRIIFRRDTQWLNCYTKGMAALRCNCDMKTCLRIPVWIEDPSKPHGGEYDRTGKLEAASLVASGCFYQITHLR